MSKIDRFVVQQVIERADIVEVVGDFLKLRKTGVRYTALCPFHDDRRDGNFIVYPKGNCYKCFTCDAKGGVVDFLMEYAKMSFPDAIRWLGRKYCIDVDNVPIYYTPPPPRPTPPPLPVMELPREWVSYTMKACNDSVLVRWLRTLNISAEKLKDTLWMYCVGGWQDGRVVFWMIDEKGKPRTAKIMKYLENGHRDKDKHPSWIHNQYGYSQACKPDEHTVKKPLFGMHLLNRFKDASVHIVESEKTALIMSAASDTKVWMACGGVENLNREKLAPIIEQGRWIVLYPDKDAIDKWKVKAVGLHYDKFIVNTQMVTEYWKEEDGEKADIADVVVRILKTKENDRRTKDKE